MKRIILISTILILALSAGRVNAQNSNNTRNTIGLRATNGLEVSYQRFIASTRRIELNAGFGRYSAGVVATHQWLFPINKVNNGSLRVYGGGGVNLGVWTNRNTGFNGALVAQAGAEYEFKNIPLILSADYRPTIHLISEALGNLGDVAISVRYTF